MKKCPICLKDKPNNQFQFGYATVQESEICNKCLDLMNDRLIAFTEFDKRICKAFGLDYWNVSNFEKNLRRQGVYREHLDYKKKGGDKHGS